MVIVDFPPQGPPSRALVEQRLFFIDLYSSLLASRNLASSA